MNVIHQYKLSPVNIINLFLINYTKDLLIYATLLGKQEPLIQQFVREHTYFIFESQIITKSVSISSHEQY